MSKHFYKTLSLRSSVCLTQNFSLVLGIFGAALLVNGLAQISSAQYQSPDFNDELIRNAVGNLLAMLEGAFGALIMVVAGLFAIIAAAMGSYRSAISMLVVALGAFILRALVSLFFGQDFEALNVGYR